MHPHDNPQRKAPSLDNMPSQIDRNRNEIPLFAQPTSPSPSSARETIFDQTPFIAFKQLSVCGKPSSEKYLPLRRRGSPLHEFFKSLKIFVRPFICVRGVENFTCDIPQITWVFVSSFYNLLSKFNNC
jgi:hypothetical protein